MNNLSTWMIFIGLCLMLGGGIGYYIRHEAPCVKPSGTLTFNEDGLRLMETLQAAPIAPPQVTIYADSHGSAELLDSTGSGTLHIEFDDGAKMTLAIDHGLFEYASYLSAFTADTVYAPLVIKRPREGQHD